ncbi:MerR family transcriptional regulator [Chitinophaga filiformis]|uniref:MerR family transcriptional regulator n=1 Tax=Chitinophaga filiformis TaxID=104663 RepID=A0ABY4I5T0_CHIFI|nr:MerR family transcriptional regulator [Chitinophaga filiformis]UPK70121.1 MerR family transcriptional regulator [Chitinophaga filiformis]
MMQQLDLFSAPDPKPKPPVPEPVPEQVAVQKPPPKPLPEVEIPVKIQVQMPPDNLPPVPFIGTGASVTATQPPQKKRGRKSLKEVADDPDLMKALDAIPLDKQYYSISEVATMFRVNTSLIRYWENEFDILQPKKNRKGDRLFRQEDIQHLKLIYHLLRERKYTIEGAKQKLKEDRKLAARSFEMVQALLKVKGFLTELKEQL